jgi:hypothetical protein
MGDVLVVAYPFGARHRALAGNHTSSAPSFDEFMIDISCELTFVHCLGS